MELLNKFQDWGLNLYHWVMDVAIHPLATLGHGFIVGVLGSGAVLGFLTIYTLLTSGEK